MNIEIKGFEDLEGNIQTALITDRLKLEELQRLGPVLGRLISMNLHDRTNMMAVLKQIYSSAGWQIVHDTEGFVTEAEDIISSELFESYVEEIQNGGALEDIFIH